MSRIIIRNAVLSYPKLDKPDEKGKFGAVLVLTAGQEDQITMVKKAALDVLVGKFGKDEATKMIKKGRVVLAGNKHSTIRVDVDKYEELGAIGFVNARATDKPGLVSTVPDKNGKPSVIDAAPFYAGCIVNASVTLYFKEVDGNAGVWSALNNVQFVRDGEKRLDSRVDAASEFEADPNAVATLDSLVESDEAAEEEDSLDDLLK
jgi:hypothetical protein